VLINTGKGVDLLTHRKFMDFYLQLEFKLSLQGGHGKIEYRKKI
jgi:hypothetical protein